MDHPCTHQPRKTCTSSVASGRVVTDTLEPSDGGGRGCQVRLFRKWEARTAGTGSDSTDRVGGGPDGGGTERGDEGINERLVVTRASSTFIAL
jgi:hypothetical protein